MANPEHFEILLHGVEVWNHLRREHREVWPDLSLTEFRDSGFHSGQSLQLPAVIRKIEGALQKENDLARLGKEPEVLFSIRLDDYIFKSEHYRKAVVRQKNRW